MVILKFFIYCPHTKETIVYRWQYVKPRQFLEYTNVIKRLQAATQNLYKTFELTWHDGHHTCILNNSKDLRNAVDYLLEHPTPDHCVHINATSLENGTNELENNNTETNTTGTSDENNNHNTTDNKNNKNNIIIINESKHNIHSQPHKSDGQNKQIKISYPPLPPSYSEAIRTSSEPKLINTITSERRNSPNIHISYRLSEN